MIVERCIEIANSLREQLEALYEHRDHGGIVPLAKVRQLEDILEDCATHPAFADCVDFQLDTSVPNNEKAIVKNQRKQRRSL